MSARARASATSSSTWTAIASASALLLSWACAGPVTRGTPAEEPRTEGAPAARFQPPAPERQTGKGEGTANAVPNGQPPPPRPRAGSAPPGMPCGIPHCLAFDEPAQAIEHLIALSPRVIGIGEAHALAGSEARTSTAELFWRELLPPLEGRASHLLVELLQPRAECTGAARAAEGVAREVARGQSQTAKSDYVELGHQAKARGITPFLLSPTCVEYRRIREAGDDRLAAMLEVIATVTARMARRALAGLDRAGSPHIVLAYGGALHNDLQPDDVHRPWSYGPDLQAATAGRYLELDLIRRGQVGDGPAWRRLPWYEAFRSGQMPRDKAVLLAPQPGSYVLFFPAGDE